MRGFCEILLVRGRFWVENFCTFFICCTRIIDPTLMQSRSLTVYKTLHFVSAQSAKCQD